MTELLKRTASSAGLTFNGCTRGTPMASAMRSARPWSTAAKMDTASVAGTSIST